MKPRLCFTFTLAWTLLIGCAHAPRPAQSASRPVSPAVNSDARVNAAASLDQLQPPIALPPPADTSRLGPPPIEAVRLFAQAHAALLDNDRAAAIPLLEKAVALDPYSYELHARLGRLYLAPNTDFNPRSIAMLEKAAALEPDHLRLQVDLARQYLARGDVADALPHLRMALLTSDYKSGDSEGIIADLLLANALASAGYDQAALETFQKLSTRLHAMSDELPAGAELAPLLAHIEIIDVQIAQLLARRGHAPEALTLYAKLIVRDPGNFDIRRQQVDLLRRLNRSDEAIGRACDAVVHFAASPESIALLRQAAGPDRPRAALDAVARLHREHPANHNLLYALIDLERASGQNAEALKLLDQAAARNPADFGILLRRVELTRQIEGVIPAARLLVAATAAVPALARQSDALFERLSRPGALPRLRWTDLQAMKLAPQWEGARQYWIARLAELAHRDEIARQAIDRALAAQPPFAPAFRARIREIEARPDLTPAQKAARADQLSARAASAIGEQLAEELRGIAALRDNPKQAVARLKHARQLSHGAGDPSPDLLLELATALRSSGDSAGADPLLWKLVSDHPLLRDGWLDLYLSEIGRGKAAAAQRVLTTWLASDPKSVAAWQMQAIDYQRAGRTRAAEAILIRLFNEQGDDPEVIAALRSFLVGQRHEDQLIALLRDRHRHVPADYTISEALAESLAQAGRTQEAAGVADEARQAARNDPDVLYALSGLYSRLGNIGAAEQVLESILKLDPSDASAANDLGYLLAEARRDLSRALELADRAVRADPHNPSFLDSMGWVLYKMGRFTEARTYLDRAIGLRDASSAQPADPVLLAHRGDVLYRLGEKQAAAADWGRAADRIAADSDEATQEMKTLAAELLRKTHQFQAGQPVQVAPVQATALHHPPTSP